MGEMVAIGTSSLTSLNQVMVEAGFRAPLVSRAQDLFILDMTKQRVCGEWKIHLMIAPLLYARSSLLHMDKDSNCELMLQK